jgi:hypothetical protein
MFNVSLLCCFNDEHIVFVRMKRITSLVLVAAIPIFGLAIHARYKNVYFTRSNTTTATTISPDKKENKKYHDALEAHHVLPVTLAEESCSINGTYSTSITSRDPTKRRTWMKQLKRDVPNKSEKV